MVRRRLTNRRTRRYVRAMPRHPEKDARRTELRTASPAPGNAHRRAAPPTGRGYEPTPASVAAESRSDTLPDGRAARAQGWGGVTDRVGHRARHAARPRGRALEWAS